MWTVDTPIAVDKLETYQVATDGVILPLQTRYTPVFTSFEKGL